MLKGLVRPRLYLSPLYETLPHWSRGVVEPKFIDGANEAEEAVVREACDILLS